MTRREIALVQATWRQVQPLAERTAEFFYGRLFALDPSLRPMFRTGMPEQGRKLMATITVAVDSLPELESLAPTVRALGKRHAGYAVEERHYATVGAALIWTFERVLGTGFTQEMAQAWSKAYELLADLMKQGMKEGHAVPTRAL